MHNLGHTGILIDDFSFNIEPFCSDVCGDHRHPQTVAEICRNMSICRGFRAVAAREKYPGFILLSMKYCTVLDCFLMALTSHFKPLPEPMLTHISIAIWRH